MEFKWVFCRCFRCPQCASRWDCTLLASQQNVQGQGLAHSWANPFVIVTGSQCFFAMGCFILPNSTLPQVEQALYECPKGHTPLLIRDLNINLCAPVEDVCGLTDLFKHFLEQSCGHTWGRWTWRMRRVRRWVTYQWDTSVNQKNVLTEINFG